MRPTIIRVIILLLTFTVGVSVAASWRALLHSSSKNSVKKSETIIIGLRVENRWKLKSWSSAKGLYGCIQAFEYETTNGEMLFYSSEPFASSTKANKDLRRIIKNAYQIIERAPKLDWHKRKVGKRVVAIFLTKDEKQRFLILWTDKSVLRIVASSTLELALDYEDKEARWNRS